MSVINIRNFGGIAPRVPPRYLQEHQAQVAVNCPTWLGSLQPLVNTTKVMDFSKVGTIASIYRFGQDVASSTQYWFHWTSDVDVVRGFINGDTSERTFFTGDGIPKATDNTLALGGAGTDYPYAAYMLGIPVPSAPTVAAQGTPDDGATTESRVYVYTIVNSWGEESAPSPVASVDVQTGQTVGVTFPAAPAGDYDPQYRRLYRSVSGTYLLVYVNGGTLADIPIATLNVTDDCPVDDLGEELPSLSWLPPVAGLKGLIGLPGGVLAGFDGIDVYFSDPYHPFAWPVQYQQTLGYPVVGLAAIDTTVVALTKGKPSFIQGSHPDSMAVIDADVSQACLSKDSIVSLNGAVYYAAPDGLVALSPGGSRIVTEQMYSKAQWQQLAPASITAFAYDGLYVAFYDTGVVQGGFIYDPRSGSFTTHNMFATGGYAELKDDSLYLVVNNELHTWGTGPALTYVWRSKKFTMPDSESFGCFRVNAETYPITFSLYRDGVLSHTESVTDDDIRRLPPGYGHDFDIELSGTGEVYSVQIASTPAEILGG